MANEDKAKCHFQVFYEAKKGHFTMVRNGKKPSMTFKVKRGQRREMRLYCNSGTIHKFLPRRGRGRRQRGTLLGL